MTSISSSGRNVIREGNISKTGAAREVSKKAMSFRRGLGGLL
jgi:hypothetical protein